MRLDEAPDALTIGGGSAAAAATPDRALNIVHVFRAPVGGLFRHVRDLAQIQHKAGHRVGIVCDTLTGGDFEKGQFADVSPFLALGIHRFPMKREISPSDLAATWRTLRAVWPLNPDILHAHGAKGGAYARTVGTLLRASGKRVARIYTPHGGSLQYDPATRRGQIYFAAEHALSWATDAFIFVSQYEADAFADKVGKPAALTVVAHNGLRAIEFTPVHPAPDARDFLFIGAMRRLKAPDDIISAMALIRERTGRTPTAWFVGAGDKRPIYEKVVHDLALDDAITFRDPMPPREAFQMAHVVVAPSRHESLPYLILEAVAAEMPLITTKVGGLPEIFGPEADRLLPPDDPVRLADAMMAARSNPQAARATAARIKAYIRSRFAVETMAATVSGVYAQVTAR